MVDSYTNTKVRRNYPLKDLVVDPILDAPPPQSQTPTSPVDAGLSASRIRLEGDLREGKP